ncbi:MAG TPA: tetratricopeptide repeat protein [Flavobacteriia bacterium]|nr:tetratricopeptide repeat protein [Flavobacteriia bacterium]
MKATDYLWMDKYLNNELKGEDLKAFENRLQKDSDFKESFELYKNTSKTLENRIGNRQQATALKNTLETLSKKHISKKEIKEKPVFQLHKYTKYMVAAGLVILATLLWFKKEKPTYQDYASFGKMELTVRGGNMNEHLKKAENAFNSKNYTEAEKELEILINEDKTKVALQLYLAVCLMEQNKLNKAEKILKNIQKGKSVYKNKATWYLALAKLKRQDYKACKKYLKMIDKDAQEYQDAQELLKRL